MKKGNKSVLTKSRKHATMRRMPKMKSGKTRRSGIGSKSHVLEHQYTKFFVPPPPRPWQADEDISPFDQPSPLKWVPTETTYGIGV